MTDRRYICPCYRHKADIAANGRCICGLFVSPDYQNPPPPGPPPLRTADTRTPEITVYGTPWCMDTRHVRLFLNEHGVPYTFVDVDSDEAAAKRVTEWNAGDLPTPTVDIGGRIYTEPGDDTLAGILGIKL